MKPFFCLIFFCMLPLTSAFSQAAPFVPDRPGFGTATHTLSPGEIYLELGYEHRFTSKSGMPGFHQIPLTNIRFGLKPGFEINVMWDGFDASDGLEHSGSFALGTKIRAFTSDDFNISLLGLIGLSDMADDLKINPLFGLLWDYGLSEKLEAFGVVQLGYEKGRDVVAEWSLGLGMPLTGKIEVYGEYYIEYASGTKDLTHHADFGMMYRLTKNIQFDVYLAGGLGSGAYRHTGFGFSKRF